MTNTNSQASGHSARHDEAACPGVLDPGTSLGDSAYNESPSHEADGSAASLAPGAMPPSADTTAPLEDSEDGPDDEALMWHDEEGKGRIPLGTHGFLDKSLTTVRPGRRERALIGILQHAHSTDDQ